MTGSSVCRINSTLWAVLEKRGWIPLDSRAAGRCTWNIAGITTYNIAGIAMYNFVRLGEKKIGGFLRNHSDSK